MNTFYDIPNIQLSDKHFTDPMLMALAWKRAHDYVRSFNWYADNFELDLSALCLQKKCKDWVQELSDYKGNIGLTELQLVPAPKSGQWIFSDQSSDDIIAENYCVTWKPKCAEDLSLRPLAHIGIKEQTIFTLLMSCLANIVETKQGDPATSFDQVHEKGVVSYGNRLYCTYDSNDQAEHNYGSTTIYSKYFKDYQQFLKRPYHFAQQKNMEKSSDERVYIVEFDLKQFFDNVKRNKLALLIKNLIKEQEVADDSAVIVHNLLEAFKKWNWNKQAKTDYQVCPKSKEKHDIQNINGIPQGLVAGGFFANIYLLNFDACMLKLLGNSIETEFVENWLEDNPEFQDFTFPKIKLIDYCRYVDDIRLVVSSSDLHKNTHSTNTTQLIFKEYIKKYLSNHCEGLEFNFDKTRFIPYTGLPKGISTQLQDIGARVSSPQGPEEVDNLIGELETLLALSTSDTSAQDTSTCNINKLADIERSTLDVREDTLRRFAANKLAKALKEKRHFTSREVDAEGKPIAGDWDYLQERVARRLIAVWSKDPALVVVLKKAFELFPCSRLLNPVLEQFNIIFNRTLNLLKDKTKVKELQFQLKQQQAMMHYCLAEIFRHSATVIHKKDPQAIPAHAKVAEYFEILQYVAAQKVNKKVKNNNSSKKTKWDFLTEQARFLLLVRLDTVLEHSTGDHEQDLIFKLAKGFRNITTNLDEETTAQCMLLADQLLTDNQPLLRASCSLLSKNIDTAHITLTSIATQNPIFAKQLIKHGQLLHLARKSHTWAFNDDIKELSSKIYLNEKPSTKPLGTAEQIRSSERIYQFYKSALKIERQSHKNIYF